MKKTSRKLALSRETLQNLTQESRFGAVIGGDDPVLTISQLKPTCANTCDCPVLTISQLRHC
jgi:hypothetical protein